MHAVVISLFADLRRVCYYTNWAQYRNGPAKFSPRMWTQIFVRTSSMPLLRWQVTNWPHMNGTMSRQLGWRAC